MENYDLDNFEPAAKIVVIGVGGAGNNAVNRMIDEEIQNVDFWVANTDKQALSTSKSLHRLILGQEITGGLGAILTQSRYPNLNDESHPRVGVLTRNNSNQTK